MQRNTRSHSRPRQACTGAASCVIHLGEIQSAVLTTDRSREVDIKLKFPTEELEGFIISIITEEVDSRRNVAGHAIDRDILMQCHRITRDRNTAAGVVGAFSGRILSASGFLRVQGRVNVTTRSGA